MKSRVCANGVHCFHRLRGLNALLDKLRSEDAVWLASPRQVLEATTFTPYQRGALYALFIQTMRESYLMKISFYTDPVSIDALCDDLASHGAVFIETTRPNFRKIAKEVNARGTNCLPLAAQGADGDFDQFLFCHTDHAYQAGTTEKRVVAAVLAWRAAGEPIPHLERL